MHVFSIGLVLGLVGTVFGLSPLESFYPPSLNQTSYISNSSIRTYGGIYKAPTNAHRAMPGMAAFYLTFEK